MKAVSFHSCVVSFLARVHLAGMWLSTWQSPAALAAHLLWQASDWNNQISTFSAVTQNNFNPSLLFNYLRLISIPGTWWYSFSVSKRIFTSSLFIGLATLYLCVFIVLSEILLCEISSAIIISGECLSSASGRLQHFHVFLRINVCPAFEKPSAQGMLFVYSVLYLSLSRPSGMPYILHIEVQTSAKKYGRGLRAGCLSKMLLPSLSAWVLPCFSAQQNNTLKAKECF